MKEQIEIVIITEFVSYNTTESKAYYLFHDNVYYIICIYLTLFIPYTQVCI